MGCGAFAVYYTGDLYQTLCCAMLCAHQVFGRGFLAEDGLEVG